MGLQAYHVHIPPVKRQEVAVFMEQLIIITRYEKMLLTKESQERNTCMHMHKLLIKGLLVSIW